MFLILCYYSNIHKKLLIMDLREYIDTYRQIQNTLLEFIDDEENSKDKYSELKKVLTNDYSDKDKFKNIISLISSISDNHHRNSEFFTKIKEIILLLKDEIKRQFTNKEIFKIFKNNKRTLLLLINENILIPDEKIIKKMKSEDMDYLDYLFSSKDDDFLAKQSKGENDNYICELIRNDSIDDFIIYTQKNSIPVNSRIKHSIFESNVFLIGKKPLLIEYAAFYGSIQIFQYLKMNYSELRSDLWLYAIHSKSGDLIQQIESLSIEPKDATFAECFIESIKCHHNDIATYIENTHLEEEWSKIDHVVEIILMNQNYAFYSDDKEKYMKSIPYLLENQYFTLLQKVLNNEFMVGIDGYVKISKTKEYSYESYIVECKSDRKKYVLKISKEYYPSIDEFSKIIECDYPSVLKFRGYSPVDFENEKRPAIIVDYFQHSLRDYIFSRKFDNNETKNYIMILGITIGMRYLHKKGIIHNLFCPLTILIDENLYPIISEFEVSERLLDDEGHAFFPEEHKIYPFLSPEKMESGVSSAASNVFAFHYIVYQIVTKRFHFEGRECMRSRLFEIIERGEFRYLSNVENECIRKLILNCCDMNPDNRMTFDQILEYITNEEFIEGFGYIDIFRVKKYLEIYGDEFKEIINKL